MGCFLKMFSINMKKRRWPCKKDLEQVQQQCSLFLPRKDLRIIVILADMAFWMFKYHETLLRDSLLSLLSIVKFFSSLESKMILKMPNETFLRNTLYLSTVLHCKHSFSSRSSIWFWNTFNQFFIGYTLKGVS